MDNEKIKNQKRAWVIKNKEKLKEYWKNYYKRPEKWIDKCMRDKKRCLICPKCDKILLTLRKRVTCPYCHYGYRNNEMGFKVIYVSRRYLRKHNGEL